MPNNEILFRLHTDRNTSQVVTKAVLVVPASRRVVNASTIDHLPWLPVGRNGRNNSPHPSLLLFGNIIPPAEVTKLALQRAHLPFPPAAVDPPDAPRIPPVEEHMSCPSMTAEGPRMACILHYISRLIFIIFIM